jgi:hypothetical protein
VLQWLRRKELQKCEKLQKGGIRPKKQARRAFSPRGKAAQDATAKERAGSGRNSG